MTKSGTPINPRLILAFSLIPGAGHVALGLATRGLMFLFFIIVLGWVSSRLLPENFSFFSRHAGGFFIYGLSVLDAYKIAKVRSLQRQL